MKKVAGPLIAIIVLVVIAAIMIVPSYNKLVNLEEDVDQSYAQIETQLQRRVDLIPNLVNTVKGYASHEKEVLENIANARSKMAGAQGPEEQAAADSELSSALSRLLVVVENYPDLKANQNFQQLMDELAGTENRIAVARKDYNDVVSVFNRTVKRFPGKIVASIFGFDEKEYFKAVEGAQQPPSVDFGDDAK
ncbi:MULTISPECIES: LemA family protein [unclassified Sporosarcina]|uniref:LemA family protein n=1 Tax=unclassified Sporosarcina TaxID=2647733 RepID=UPI000C16FFFD|nr:MULTISPECIES: LemA family protein [unclassified Sporosarcina]PIC85018.1 LemA family protein [Sporosarcina sp. P20a]PIC98239.1 LemA family protein [Sporosarcina sp. P29]PID04706.1 LemA family protein [Sporosarcina sp. P30]PID08099.1 LemA family protein [Sporosarcina sp. P31]PID11046.1 LemA family protein [Sporosarcina sp. P32b]